MSSRSKIGYASRWTAMAAMRGIASKHGKRDRTCPTGTYLCGVCRTWQLTSKSGHQIPPWEKARARR